MIVFLVCAAFFALGILLIQQQVFAGAGAVLIGIATIIAIQASSLKLVRSCLPSRDSGSDAAPITDEQLSADGGFEAARNRVSTLRIGLGRLAAVTGLLYGLAAQNWYFLALGAAAILLFRILGHGPVSTHVTKQSHEVDRQASQNNLIE